LRVVAGVVTTFDGGGPVTTFDGGGPDGVFGRGPDETAALRVVAGVDDPIWINTTEPL
jgi:hypothetical protein